MNYAWLAMPANLKHEARRMASATSGAGAGYHPAAGCQPAPQVFENNTFTNQRRPQAANCDRLLYRGPKLN
jgi:hypothetical protein